MTTGRVTPDETTRRVETLRQWADEWERPAGGDLIEAGTLDILAATFLRQAATMLDEAERRRQR